MGKDVDVDALPLSCFFFRPSEAAQIPLKSPGGQGLCYARKEGTQRLTAGHTGILRTPLKKCSLTADDGASPPLEWCTASAEMVHGGRGRGAPGRHAGDYSGMPLRLRMDSPSIWMV